MLQKIDRITKLNEYVYGAGFKIGLYNIIGVNVKIGCNVTIGHHCIIEDDVEIGDNTSIGNYVLLNRKTVIKNNVFVDSYVRSSGDNFINNNVTIRYGATIARKVSIEEDVFISPNVMTIYTTHRRKKSPGTFLKKKCFIGTAAVIGGGVTIGEEVIVGAMAFVSKDCLEKGNYVGVPARLISK